MGRTRRRSLFLALETGGYAVDPSSDGSGYLPAPAEQIGDIQDGPEMNESGYQTGREWDTQVEPGADFAELQFLLPLWGLLDKATDGVDASTNADDVWDLVLRHLYGTQRTTVGEGLTTSTAGPPLTLQSDTLNINDLTLLGFASNNRGFVRRIAVDNLDNSYTMDQALPETITSSWDALGAKIYVPNQPYTGGDTLSAVFVDDDIGTYRLAGGRVTSVSISGEVAKRAMASITMRFDSATEEAATKTALPAAVNAPPATAIPVLWSPVYFNGSVVDTSKIEIDFGISTAEVLDTGTANGRSGHEMIKLKPVLKLDPLRTDALRTLKRAAAKGVVGIQLGAGVISGATADTWGLAFPVGQVVEGEKADQDGLARYAISIEAKDPGATDPIMVVGRF